MPYPTAMTTAPETSRLTDPFEPEAANELLQHAEPGARTRDSNAAAERAHRESRSPSAVPERATTALRWSRSELAGRLVELSSWGGGALLTLAFELVLQAQQEAEPVAWITGSSTFFPPDAARCGIDLDALPVIRVPDAACAARAADKLLRSGAFGLIVLDLGTQPFIPPPLQTRLLGLASKHDAAVLFLTEKPGDAPSLGSLVSLRAQAVRSRTGEDKFSCEARVLKDKRRGPGWSHRELRHGPAGLR
jgi:recombination protein RecA